MRNACRSQAQWMTIIVSVVQRSIRLDVIDEAEWNSITVKVTRKVVDFGWRLTQPDRS